MLESNLAAFLKFFIGSGSPGDHPKRGQRTGKKTVVGE
jgi:hypothetical protein